MARRYKTRARIRKAQRAYRARKKAYSAYQSSYLKEREQWIERGERIFDELSYKQFKETGKEDANKYITYLKLFRERKEVFENRDYDFYDPKPLTFKAWKTMYAEKLNDLKAEVKSGDRSSIGSVNRELVSDQAYELSSSKANVIAEYLYENNLDLIQKLGLDYKILDPETGTYKINLKKKIELTMKLRQGEFVSKEIGLWDMINGLRNKLSSLSEAQIERLKKKHNAATKAEAIASEVSSTFFDSPD